jgi:hypothetical protein
MHQFTKTTHEICKFIGRMYKYRVDAKTALETMTEPLFMLPMDPDRMATRTEVQIWEKQGLDEHVKRGNMQAENLKIGLLTYLQAVQQCNASKAGIEGKPSCD